MSTLRMTSDLRRQLILGAAKRCFARNGFAGTTTRSVAAGEASRIGSEPLNLFWFAHHTVLTAALTRLPAVPCLSYGNAAGLERQLCEFILRGIGLNETAMASHLDRELSPAPGQSVTAESA
jgi:hypothetical protein